MVPDLLLSRGSIGPLWAVIMATPWPRRADSATCRAAGLPRFALLLTSGRLRRLVLFPLSGPDGFGRWAAMKKECGRRPDRGNRRSRCEWSLQLPGPLYDDAAPRVYRYLFRMCAGSAALAEDLTQETFLTALGRFEDSARRRRLGSVVDGGGSQQVAGTSPSGRARGAQAQARVLTGL